MQSRKEIMDIFIIGGGINGMGIAVDAAGRGLQVGLCDQNDFGAETSAWSTKLIHGGLRYLEQYEFKLVREALKEREILMQKAPHLIHPLRFVLPHSNQQRPAWMLRLGLFLYDNLYRSNSLEKSQQINCNNNPLTDALKDNIKKAFAYSDCQTDDARLVILNAIAAHEQGAKLYQRTKLINAKRDKNSWLIELQQANGETLLVESKCLINATGPWVDKTIKLLKLKTKTHINLVKGSHIVIPQHYPGEHAYILQSDDNRIIFAIPYQNEFTLIGTTDIEFTGDPQQAHISEEETKYLITSVNNYFKKPITKNDICWSYSGVRPLHGKQQAHASEISRGFSFELDQYNDKAPILHIFGGKLTTYRILAEQALNRLKHIFPHMQANWTANAALPGGDLENTNFANFCQSLQQQYPWLEAQQRQRYARQYGSRIHTLLKGCTCLADLGKHWGAELYQQECTYLAQYEFAQTAEDILWRRTKLGLKMSVEAIESFKKHWQNNT